MPGIIQPTTSYGLGQPINIDATRPIIAKRVPAANDRAPLGQLWVVPATNSAYMITSIVDNVATWVNLTDNGVLTITGGNGINITGTPSNPIINLTAPVSIANGGTNTAAPNTNGVIYFDGTRYTGTTVGTAGQVLTSNGVGLAPTYQAVTLPNPVPSLTINPGPLDLTGSFNQTGTYTLTGSLNQTGDYTGTGNFQSSAGTFTVNSGNNAINITNTGGGNNIALTTASQIQLNSSAVVFTTASVTITSPTASGTLQALIGRVILNGFTTAAAATQVITITNSLHTATSHILASVSQDAITDSRMSIVKIRTPTNSLVFTLQNTGTATLSGSMVITFWILS